jgi:hypothetical protein
MSDSLERKVDIMHAAMLKAGLLDTLPDAMLMGAGFKPHFAHVWADQGERGKNQCSIGC